MAYIGTGKDVGDHQIDISCKTFFHKTVEVFPIPGLAGKILVNKNAGELPACMAAYKIFIVFFLQFERYPVGRICSESRIYGNASDRCGRINVPGYFTDNGIVTMSICRNRIVRITELLLFSRYGFYFFLAFIRFPLFNFYSAVIQK